jgi:hypothetical protein
MHGLRLQKTLTKDSRLWGGPSTTRTVSAILERLMIRNRGADEMVESSVVVLGDNDRNRANGTGFSILATRSPAEVDPTIAKCSSPTKL